MDNVAYNNTGEGAPTLLAMKTYPEKMQVIMDGTDGLAKDNGKVAEYETSNSVVIVEEEMVTDKDQATEPYPDMGKEDLLRFSETTFWRRARLISILLFWLAWLALLGTVIGLTIVAPRCGDPPQPQWWQKSVIYQIYVRSFYDSDADGIGDIRGIADKLAYIKDLGVDAILLSSIYDSEAEQQSNGRADYGYEVIDHKAIGATYGTMTDLDDLIRRSHENDISVILDFIPNYTSRLHAWFQSSSTDDSYSNHFWNYYVWSKDATLPNQWMSVYEEPAWSSVTGGRNGLYLHQFLNTQPELNLRSKYVQDELNSILEFWMDKGVDGFRVVSSAFLFESADLADNQPCTPGDDSCPYENTQSQLEVYDMVARWRSTLDKFENATFRGRTLLTDGDVSISEAMNYYGTFGRSGANLPINYQLTKINSTCDNLCVSNLVYGWLDTMPSDATADWMTGDQNRPRLTSNVGEELAIAVNMIKMTLPGSAIIYYGEEIGMINGADAGKDAAGGINPKYSRDGFRSPMQWTSNNETAGFSNSTPWIPVPAGADLSRFNVEDQYKDENSILNKFRSLSQLRRDQQSLQFGKLHKINTNAVFAFIREHEGFSRILVVGCFGSGSAASGIDLTTKGLSDIGIPSQADVLFVTNSSLPFKAGDTVDLKTVSLSPGHGFVAAWDYKRP